MTEKCFDSGIIQAFLDGELAAEMTEAVARHVSVCDDCAILMATAEEESAIAFSALDQEFNTLVPTQRLWTKINDSIESEKKSFWKPIFAFLLQPSTAAFASLLFVALVSVTLLSLKPDAPVNNIALKTDVKEPKLIQTASTAPATPVNNQPQVIPTERPVETVVHKESNNQFRAVKTSYVEPKKVSARVIQPKVESDVVVPAPSENILGEASYIKTIETLAQTVNNRKDEVLDASSRFAYERDLAVTDDAIKQMRKEVKKDPKNEAAKHILRTSYQNKIDLLNSVADKTELMASLK